MRDFHSNRIKPEQISALIREQLELIIQEQSDEIMSVSRASEYTSLAKQTLYHYTSKEVIPFYRSPGGKTIFFKKSELDSWLTSNPVKPRVTESNSSYVFNKADEILRDIKQGGVS